MLVAWIFVGAFCCILVWWSGWECGLRKAKAQYWKGYSDRDHRQEPGEYFK